jgi:hypothetical protein
MGLYGNLNSISLTLIWLDDIRYSSYIVTYFTT